MDVISAFLWSPPYQKWYTILRRTAAAGSSPLCEGALQPLVVCGARELFGTGFLQVPCFLHGHHPAIKYK